MVFELSANKLLGLEPSRSKVLRKSFFDFVRGLISFPLYLPGTAYYACMQVINLTTILACVSGFLKSIYMCTSWRLIKEFRDQFQGRMSAMEVLRQVLEERKQSAQALGGGARPHGDFLDYVVQEITKEKPVLTEGMALDLMFLLLFASFHTTSLALTLAVKLLSDHPRVLDELTVSTYVCVPPCSRCQHDFSSRAAMCSTKNLAWL
jgi:cytochrome P450